MNPLDYVYRCLDCKIELMDETSSEAQHLLRYIATTHNGRQTSSLWLWCHSEQPWLSSHQSSNYAGPRSAWLSGSFMGPFSALQNQFSRGLRGCHVTQLFPLHENIHIIWLAVVTCLYVVWWHLVHDQKVLGSTSSHVVTLGQVAPHMCLCVSGSLQDMRPCALHNS